MTLLELPNLIIREILLLLPPKTLHNCRQVNKKFNEKIINLIWSTKYGRKRLIRRVQKNWANKTYNIFYDPYR